MPPDVEFEVFGLFGSDDCDRKAGEGGHGKAVAADDVGRCSEVDDLRRDKGSDAGGEDDSDSFSEGLAKCESKLMTNEAVEDPPVFGLSGQVEERLIESDRQAIREGLPDCGDGIRGLTGLQES